MIKIISNILIVGLALFVITSCGGGGTSNFGTTGSNGSGGSNSSVPLNWTPPTENTDSSPLTDITGYKVYYGLSANALTNTYTLMDPNASSVTVPSLASNTLYYFSVKVLNSKNVESDFSNIISKSTS